MKKYISYFPIFLVSTFNILVSFFNENYFIFICSVLILIIFLLIFKYTSNNK